MEREWFAVKFGSASGDHLNTLTITLNAQLSDKNLERSDPEPNIRHQIGK